MGQCAPERFRPTLENARGALHAPDGDFSEAGETLQLSPDGFAQVAIGADGELANGEAFQNSEEGQENGVGGDVVVDPGHRLEISAEPEGGEGVVGDIRISSEQGAVNCAWKVSGGVRVDRVWDMLASFADMAHIEGEIGSFDQCF